VTDVALHEAAHAAAAIWFNRPVAHVWREPGHVLPGETAGHARIPVGERIEPSQVAICVAGYLAEGRPGWPPDFEDAVHEPLEGLGFVLRKLGATRDQYEQTVAQTRELLADERLRRLRSSIARALAACPRLEREGIEALCRATATPIPNP
jgi:hypothetical protein